MVDPCDAVERDGQPYAVCVNGYDATVKRVRKLNNGFVLEPDSTDPTYERQVFNYNEAGTQAVIVIGLVVYYVLPDTRQFRSQSQCSTYLSVCLHILLYLL